MLGLGSAGTARTPRNSGGCSAQARGRVARIARLCGAGLGLGSGRRRSKARRGKVLGGLRVLSRSGAAPVMCAGCGVGVRGGERARAVKRQKSEAAR